jgi:hypothetical protein
MNDHTAEHFVENPLLLEPGHALFIKVHDDPDVNPHMGMAPRLPGV